jgi:hypothetical protein
MLDESLLAYATKTQALYLNAVIKHGTQAAAARALNVNPSRVNHALARLTKSAALRGYSPEHDMTRTVPFGFTVKGVSTYYDKEGNQKGQWVKSRADIDERLQLMQEAINSLCEEITPLAPAPLVPLTGSALCNLYTITDAHVGMMAWHREGGANWDLKEAERVLTGCFTAMIAQSPRADTAVVNIQGDFLHFDGLKAITPEHGHILDADGRFSKVVAVAIRIIRYVVAQALASHAKVHLMICEGNHDESSSVWMRQMFTVLYELEPRITVDDSELPYHVYQHGDVMLGFHHGHKTTDEKLPLLFAAQFPRVWGRTLKRYAHTGHRHHEQIKDHGGMTVTRHATLSARDAYAARGGWVSERHVKCITYHENYGQVAVTTVVPEMLL